MIGTILLVLLAVVGVVLLATNIVVAVSAESGTAFLYAMLGAAFSAVLIGSVIVILIP